LKPIFETIADADSHYQNNILTQPIAYYKLIENEHCAINSLVLLYDFIATSRLTQESESTGVDLNFRKDVIAALLPSLRNRCMLDCLHTILDHFLHDDYASLYKAVPESALLIKATDILFLINSKREFTYRRKIMPKNNSYKCAVNRTISLDDSKEMGLEMHNFSHSTKRPYRKHRIFHNAYYKKDKPDNSQTHDLQNDLQTVNYTSSYYNRKLMDLFRTHSYLFDFVDLYFGNELKPIRAVEDFPASAKGTFFISIRDAQLLYKVYASSKNNFAAWLNDDTLPELRRIQFLKSCTYYQHNLSFELLDDILASYQIDHLYKINFICHAYEICLKNKSSLNDQKYRLLNLYSAMNPYIAPSIEYTSIVCSADSVENSDKVYQIVEQKVNSEIKHTIQKKSLNPMKDTVLRSKSKELQKNINNKLLKPLSTHWDKFIADSTSLKGNLLYAQYHYLSNFFKAHFGLENTDLSNGQQPFYTESFINAYYNMIVKRIRSVQDILPAHLFSADNHTIRSYFNHVSNIFNAFNRQHYVDSSMRFIFSSTSKDFDCVLELFPKKSSDCDTFFSKQQNRDDLLIICNYINSVFDYFDYLQQTDHFKSEYSSSENVILLTDELDAALDIFRHAIFGDTIDIISMARKRAFAYFYSKDCSIKEDIQMLKDYDYDSTIFYPKKLEYILEYLPRDDSQPQSFIINEKTRESNFIDNILHVTDPETEANYYILLAKLLPVVQEITKDFLSILCAEKYYLDVADSLLSLLLPTPQAPDACILRNGFSETNFSLNSSKHLANIPLEEDFEVWEKLLNAIYADPVI